MQVHTGEEREGALLRRLKAVGQGGRMRHMGFATGEDGARKRPMVIVARVEHGVRLADDLQNLAEAGADAIEILVRPGADIADVAEDMADVQVPCGIFLAGPANWTVASGERIDWIHLGPTAPASLLAGKGTTRLISVTTDEPPGRLAGLAALKAESVVVEDSTDSTEFSVETLMALCTIQAATKKPLLAASSLKLTPDDVEVLRDHGIEGLLVSGGTAAVRKFVKAVEAL